MSGTGPLPSGQSGQAGAPSRLTRRALGLLGGAAVVGGAVFAANWFNVGASNTQGGTLSVLEAHRRALAGDILLIDIRRPDEWARTGIGEGAQPLDMRRPDFTAALERLPGASELPIALICARGVRSKRLTGQLVEAGFINILDVPEGMLGSGAGPGWLRTGLPVVQVGRG